MTHPLPPALSDGFPSDSYDDWLDRVRSTYESVSFSCMHRLGDRLLADRVGAQVVAGMLRKPGVFRFFGLPYSARIGHLAEARIAEAKAGRRDQIAEWDRILRSLRSIPAPDRDAFVLTCVQGLEVPEIAARLGLTDQEARRLIDTALERMRAIADEELGDETSAASQTE